MVQVTDQDPIWTQAEVMAVVTEEIRGIPIRGRAMGVAIRGVPVPLPLAVMAINRDQVTVQPHNPWNNMTSQETVTDNNIIRELVMGHTPNPLLLAIPVDPVTVTHLPPGTPATTIEMTVVGMIEAQGDSRIP
jgi:hypothetical protein